MKKLLLLLTIVAITTSCSIGKQPEFKSISRIDVKHISVRNVAIKADAIFKNPNHLKGKLSIEDLKVFVDNIHVADIQSETFNVPSNDEFSIPLEASFSLSKIYKNNTKSILANVLKAFQTDSLQIMYKGNIRYHLGDYSFPYTIDKTQHIVLKK